MLIFFLFPIILIFNISLAQATSNTIYISNIYPWLITTDDNCNDGLMCNFFNSITKDATFKSNFLYTSLSRANEHFYKGDQFIALFPYNENLKAKYHLVEKVLTYNVGLLQRKTSQPLLTKNSKICITRNNPHKQKEIKYFEVNSYEQCFKMLNNGRINQVLLSDVELKFHIKDKTLSKNKNSYSFEKKYQIDLWFYINKKISEDSQTYKSLLKSFNRIDKLKLEKEAVDFKLK